MNFEVIIGIEIHCELKTQSKMFSSAPIQYGVSPNTSANEVDLAFPGTLPQVNKKAVELAIRAATALQCTIDSTLVFDRKNYYYSDLPKGYQITQDKRPIGKNGHVNVEVEGVISRIEIERLHIEEDTAKQTHQGDLTYIDYNRCGNPLIEIVTDPSIRSGKQAAAYVEKLRQMMLFMGVSDVKMEEGSLRCDVNISLRPYGYKGYGNKVEVKNLNSTANVQKAVECEIERQTALLLLNQEVIQETRRFDEALKTTVSMRKKEGVVDYKYFTEPNIFPIQLDADYIHYIQNNMPELPSDRMHRYIHQYGLTAYDASVLTTTVELSDFFDAVAHQVDDKKAAANFIIGEVSAYLNKCNQGIDQTHLNVKDLSELINFVSDKTISTKQQKQVFELMMLEGKTPAEIIETKGMKQLSDPVAIEALVVTVLEANQSSVEAYHQGRTNLLGFLVGQVLKLSKGQANPSIVNEVMVKKLEKK